MSKSSQLGTLIADLQDKKAAVRRKAAKQLGDLGASAREALYALVIALGDHNPSVRGAAQQSIDAITAALAQETSALPMEGSAYSGDSPGSSLPPRIHAQALNTETGKQPACCICHKLITLSDEESYVRGNLEYMCRNCLHQPPSKRLARAATPPTENTLAKLTQIAAKTEEPWDVQRALWKWLSFGVLVLFFPIGLGSVVASKGMGKLDQTIIQIIVGVIGLCLYGWWEYRYGDECYSTSRPTHFDPPGIPPAPTMLIWFGITMWAILVFAGIGTAIGIW